MLSFEIATSSFSFRAPKAPDFVIVTADVESVDPYAAPVTARVVLVCLSDIPSCCITLRILKLVSDKSFLKFPLSRSSDVSAKPDGWNFTASESKAPLPLVLS